MKLDVSCMRYLGKDDYRVMVAVEMGMRNHELVPVELIVSIAKLRHGGIHRILSTLLKYKLIAHANQQYNGYRLSYMGFDILALHTLLARKVIASVGRQIGVGKESDVFEAQDEHGNDLVLKIHRLGRTSFRSVRRNRDYMAGKSKASWLYMSRLAAIKEFAFMQALHAHGFPTPVPIDHNRHIVAMSRIDGNPMSQLQAGSMKDPEVVFANCLGILRRLAECGLVHCDFNEFNLMVDADGTVILIDFPQMVSTNHVNAEDLFRRDMNGLAKFFAMKMHYVPDEEQMLSLVDIPVIEAHIDEQIRASGFSKEEDNELVGFIQSNEKAAADGEEAEEDSEEEGDEEGGGEEGCAEGGLAASGIFAGSLASASRMSAGGAKSNEASSAVNGGSEGAELGAAAESEHIDSDSDVSSLAGDEEALATDSPVAAAQPLGAAELDKAREQARYNLHRKGGAHGRGHAGAGKQSRNHTKPRNKYGKVVKPEKLEAEW